MSMKRYIRAWSRRARVRKKRRLGEFKELGFQINATMPEGRTDWADAFIECLVQFAESRGLLLGGGVDRHAHAEFFVTRPGRASATEEDREATISLLEDMWPGGGLSYCVSDLQDAWA